MGQQRKASIIVGYQHIFFYYFYLILYFPHSKCSKNTNTLFISFATV